MGRRLTKSNKNRSLSSTKSSQRQNDSLENSDDEYHVDSNEHDEDEDDEEDNIHTANNHAGFVSVKTELLSDDWEDIPYLRRLSDHAATIEDADTTLKTDFGTEVDTAVWNKMYEYQRDGVQWMYKMYRDGVGGILADEMGLGKTCQLCVHFGALARLNASDHFASSSSSMDITRSDHHNSSSQPKLKPREHASAAFLIVCPATVLQHWLKEMHSWAPHIRTVILHSMSATGGELTRLGNESKYVLLLRVISLFTNLLIYTRINDESNMTYTFN